MLARKHRAQRDYQPDELRERLHRRLAEVSRNQLEPTGPSDENIAPANDHDRA
jgi:hypothetical protein